MQRDKVSPDIAEEVIEAYGEVLPNLRQHADGWPDAVQLKSRLTAGVAAYGMAGSTSAIPRPAPWRC